MSDDLKYDRSLPLYISFNQRFPIGESRKALEIAYSNCKPVIIYIHGRANNVGEPKKSEEENIYADLSAYGVSVIGFTWDADDGGYDETRPLSSADDFDTFVSALRDYLHSTGQTPPSLLAHSMGNSIIAELAKDDKLTADRGKLFNNIVLSSAAVKTKRHHKWLEKIGVSDRTYVMVNPKDPMLILAGLFARPNMLGCEARKPGVSADHGFYIHLGRLDVGHRYFVAPNQKKESSLNDFYQQALHGEEVMLDGLSEKDFIDGVEVFSIKPD